MPTTHKNYAIRTLKERLDYITERSKPKPDTEKHAAEIRAALKILEQNDVR